jgi:hypothetical protein
MGSSDSSMEITGSFPATPALATTMSIRWLGDWDSAALKAESWSDQTRTSHLMNWTLHLLGFSKQKYLRDEADLGKAVSS